MKWNEYNAAVSISTESVRTDSLVRRNPENPAAENKKPNRTRNNKITVYLSNAELAEILARKSNKQYESEKKAAASELRKSEMRIEMIPKLLKSLYEDKLSGKTSEENYSILSSEYADEREQLKKKNSEAAQENG